MTKLDFMGYEIVADGADAGRYATPEVAGQAYVNELHSYISDASKDVWGFRYRGPFPTTFAELEAECDYWVAQSRQELEAEKAYEEAPLQTFMQYAPDMETAERWLEEACNA